MYRRRAQRSQRRQWDAHVPLPEPRRKEPCGWACLDPLFCGRSADAAGPPTGRAIIWTGSGSLPVVLVDESAEEIAALDLARLGAEDPEGW